MTTARPWMAASLLAMLSLSAAACGEAVGGAADAGHGAYVESVSAAPHGPSALRRAYAALRRPARRDEVRAATVALRSLGGRFEVDAGRARAVPGTAAAGDEVFVVPADGALCLASSARRESGCDVSAGKAPAGERADDHLFALSASRRRRGLRNRPGRRASSAHPPARRAYGRPDRACELLPLLLAQAPSTASKDRDVACGWTDAVDRGPVPAR